METRRYTFTLPNYSAYSDEYLVDTAVKIIDQIKKEMSSPNGILLRTRRFATLFVQLDFCTTEMERRRPGILNMIDQEIQLDIILETLKINRNE